MRFPFAGRRPSRCSPPGPTRCSAPRSWCWLPSTRWSTSRPRRLARRHARRRGRAAPARRPRRSALPPRWRRPRPTSSARSSRGTRPACSPAPTPRNPATGADIPVFVADYVLMGYGTGAIMAVPGQDRARLGVRRGVRPAHRAHRAAAARLRRRGLRRRGSGRQLGLPRRARRGRGQGGRSSTGWSRAGHGRGTVTYKLRDWLFSRQRYWGEPFPIVYDDDDHPIALPESMLPVELPELDDFKPHALDPDDDDPEPVPPLARADEWVDGRARPGRRTAARTGGSSNVMPQWAGSCWYELRYLDPTNENRFVDPEVERYWMGPQPPPATPAASTCTSAASSTPCCTCSTPASGTRCCSTSATSRRPSRSTACSTRATSRPPPTATRGARCVPAAEVEADGTGFTWQRRGRDAASSGRWARA